MSSSAVCPGWQRACRYPRRAEILVIIAGVIVAHMVEVILDAAAYHAAQTWMGLGRIEGEIEGGALDLFYFSITTYTSSVSAICIRVERCA
jgi:hypothetical protein